MLSRPCLCSATRLGHPILRPTWPFPGPEDRFPLFKPLMQGNIWRKRCFSFNCALQGPLEFRHYRTPIIDPSTGLLEYWYIMPLRNEPSTYHYEVNREADQVSTEIRRDTDMPISGLNPFRTTQKKGKSSVAMCTCKNNRDKANMR